MASKVNVNNLTVVHATSSGVAPSFPDVCLTPSPGGPIPIPYPNIAQSSDTAMGSKTVTIEGNPVMLEGSNFATSTGDEAGVPLRVLQAVVAVNERQKHRLAEDIRRYFHGDLAGKRIALWGLAFKPGTDDMREAPALVLAEALLADGAEVVATDPVAIPAARKLLDERVRFVESSYACAEGADALAVVTEWREYRRPNFERLASVMRGQVVFDGRNIWEPAEVRKAGLAYHGIGRGTRP